MHPRFLEILLPILENESECNAVYTNYLSDAIPPDSFSESTVVQDFTRYTTQEFLLRYSNRSLILIGCYGLFVLEKLREMGGFRHLGSGYSPGGDTLIPILLSKNSSIYYLDQQLVFFRSHPNSMSINSDSMDSFITAEIDFINYASGVIAECAPDIGKRIYSQFRMWFQDNHFTVARRQSGSKLSRLVSQFIKSESQNYSLFRKFEIGFLLDVRFFASAIRRLVLRILGDAIFPVTRRKLQFFFRL